MNSRLSQKTSTLEFWPITDKNGSIRPIDDLTQFLWRLVNAFIPPKTLEVYVVKLLHSEPDFFHFGKTIREMFLDQIEYFISLYSSHWDITWKISDQSDKNWTPQSPQNIYIVTALKQRLVYFLFFDLSLYIYPKFFFCFAWKPLMDPVFMSCTFANEILD